MYMGFEEIDGDDDVREEFPCPFCSEYYDIVGLCCHIDDEHPVEANNGVLLSCSLVVDDHGLYYVGDKYAKPFYFFMLFCSLFCLFGFPFLYFSMGLVLWFTLYVHFLMLRGSKLGFS